LLSGEELLLRHLHIAAAAAATLGGDMVVNHHFKSWLEIKLLGSSTLGTAGHQLRPKILDTTDSHQWQMTRESYTKYQIWLHLSYPVPR
jgi:hypothetical protein